ncbi:MAG: carbohydrate porin [Planctomycetota bacterium]
MIPSLLISGLAVVAGWSPQNHDSQDRAPQDRNPADPLFLLGDPDIERATEFEGVTLEGAYTWEGFEVIGEGGATDGLFEIVLDLDLETLLDRPGLSAAAYFLASHGGALTELVGDFQVTSNIEAPESARLYELWLDQEFGDGSASVRGGIYDITTEFDVIPSGQLFIHSSPGTGAEFAASGVNGPSTYPISALAARLDLRPTERTYARVALGDGVPGDPDDLTSNDLVLDADEGVVLVAEGGYELGRAKYALGAWGYTTDFEALGVGRGRGSQGLYAFADHPLLGPDSERGLNAFVRLGLADDRNTTVDRYVGGGLVQRAPWSGRPHDEFGLAIAAARFSDGRDWEVAFELTYRAQVTRWFALQPDLQVVLDPSGDPTLDDAVLVGIRGMVAF